MHMPAEDNLSVSTELNQADMFVPEHRNTSPLKRGILALETAVVLTEVSPLNEVLRLGVGGYFAYKTGGNPLLSGIALGGANLLIEGGGALATADLLDTSGGTKAVGWVANKLRKTLGKDKLNKELHPLTEASLAYLGGSSIVLVAKQIKNPERTVTENRRHGLFVSVWTSGVLAVQGGSLVDAISNPSARSIATASASIGVIVSGALWAKKRQGSEITTGTRKVEL